MATTAPVRNPIRDTLGVQPPAESLDWFNGLIFAEWGTGKTHLLGTAQDHPETSPLLIFDVEGGVHTLSHRQDIDVVQVRDYDAFKDKINELHDSIEYDSKTGKPSMYYKCIGVDSLTELQSLDIGDIMDIRGDSNPNLDKDIPDPQGWNKSGAHIRKLVRVLNNLPCHVLYTCHLAEIEDSLKRKVLYPMLPGKMRKTIPGFLDFVGYMKAEQEGDETVRSIQFLGTERVKVKQRNCGFDDIEINPTIPILWDKIKVRNQKIEEETT